MKKRFINLILTSIVFGAVSLLADTGSTDVQKLIVQANKEIAQMKPDILKKMIDDEEDVVILDVRERVQRSEGRIYVGDMYADDTYAITRGNLEFDIENKIPDKDALIVTYSRDGKRGALAAQTLNHMGYKHATNLEGGLRAWAQAGFPIETGLGLSILNRAN